MLNNINSRGTTKFIAPLVIKDVRIVMKTRNFSGNNPGKYDRPGARNFSVFLDPEKVDIQALKEEGWNVNFGKPNPEDPDYIPGAFLRVHANWFPLDDSRSGLNPMVFKSVGGEMIRLDEETVKSLDTDEIQWSDLDSLGKYDRNANDNNKGKYL